MPPQPIDKVKSGAHFRLFFDATGDQGPVAQAAMRCIANWSQVELDLGYLFISLLRANLKQGAELYNSLDGARAKDAAIRALAVSALDKNEYVLFAALQRNIKSQQKTRDKLGHWIIGSSDMIPRTMIIIDPKTLWASTAAFKQEIREGLASRKPLHRL